MPEEITTIFYYLDLPSTFVTVAGSVRRFMCPASSQWGVHKEFPREEPIPVSPILLHGRPTLVAVHDGGNAIGHRFSDCYYS